MYDDDDASNDVDARLRAVLRPGDDEVRGLLARTLSARSGTRPHRRRRWAAAIAATALLIVLSAALWRGTRLAPAALDIYGTNSVIVVTRPDGNRLVFQTSAAAPARGEYVIAFPQSER